MNYKWFFLWKYVENYFDCKNALNNFYNENALGMIFTIKSTGNDI